MTMLDAFTRASGWVLLLALLAAIALGRRGGPMSLHFVLGWFLAGLTWFHLYYPMAGGLIGRTPTWALWVAVAAWVLLLIQLVLGNLLRARRRLSASGLRSAHRGVMLATLGLTALHVVVNGISLRNLVGWNSGG